MENMKRLLEYRKKLRKATPNFIRQQADSNKRIANQNNWRRPKGKQSKLRLQQRGKPKLVKVGYKTPNKVRGKSKEGLEVIVVNNLKEVMEHQKKIIILAAGIGNRKKVELLAAAKKLNIQFMNVKNIDTEIAKIHNQLKIRKDLKKKKAEEKKEKEKKRKEAKKKGAAEAKKAEAKKDEKKEELKEKLETRFPAKTGNGPKGEASREAKEEVMKKHDIKEVTQVQKNEVKEEKKAEEKHVTDVAHQTHPEHSEHKHEEKKAEEKKPEHKVGEQK